MDIQHLIYALEVKNCGSISKAAQKLFMAQPNLSNAIKELEQEINTVIFKRTSRGIEPTKEGLEFLHHADTVVSQFQSLDNTYVKESPSIVKATITSMRSSVICNRLIKYINHLNQEDFSMRIYFREGTNDEVIDDVDTGRSTLGILRANSSSYDYYCYLAKTHQCEVIPMPTGRYSVLMSKNHPLANVESLAPYMLKPYTEVIHGDFEMPWYLYSDAYAPEPDASEKLLFIYDRGSLIDCIRNIHGAYSWTFATAPENLVINGLIEKHCEGYDIGGQEAIIYKKSTLLTSKLQTLMDYLANSNPCLVQENT